MVRACLVDLSGGGTILFGIVSGRGVCSKEWVLGCC
jgi:hypothetical protein